MSVCFFFQAEDGIRDAQESRGLGDVYKRQLAENAVLKLYTSDINGDTCIKSFSMRKNSHGVWAVSYTHLTLPTIYSV